MRLYASFWGCRNLGVLPAKVTPCSLSSVMSRYFSAKGFSSLHARALLCQHYFSAQPNESQQYWCPVSVLHLLGQYCMPDQSSVEIGQVPMVDSRRSKLRDSQSADCSSDCRSKCHIWLEADIPPCVARNNGSEVQQCLSYQGAENDGLIPGILLSFRGNLWSTNERTWLFAPSGLRPRGKRSRRKPSWCRGPAGGNAVILLSLLWAPILPRCKSPVYEGTGAV